MQSVKLTVVKLAGDPAHARGSKRKAMRRRGDAEEGRGERQTRREAEVGGAAAAIVLPLPRGAGHSGCCEKDVMRD